VRYKTTKKLTTTAWKHVQYILEIRQGGRNTLSVREKGELRRVEKGRKEAEKNSISLREKGGSEGRLSIVEKNPCRGI